MFNHKPIFKLLLWLALSIFIYSDDQKNLGEIPDFEIRLLNGKKTTIYDLLESGPVLMDFWATWCKPCKKVMKHLDAFQRDFPSVPVRHNISIGGWQVVTDIQPVTVRHHTTANGTALGFDGVGAVHDHVIGVFPAHVIRQRFGFLRPGKGAQPQQADGGHGAGRAQQQAPATYR